MAIACYERSRAVDPHGSTFIFPPGSGSRRKKISTKNGKFFRKLIIIASLFNFESKFLQVSLFLLLFSNGPSYFFLQISPGLFVQRVVTVTVVRAGIAESFQGIPGPVPPLHILAPETH